MNATPLRVAMVLQRYHPFVGGAERLVGALAPRLQAHGVEACVITRRYRAGLPRFERISGVPVYRLPSPGPKAIASFMFTLGALAILQRLRPHVLHAHDVLSPAAAAMAFKRLTKAPVVVSVHSSGPQGELARLHDKPMGRQRLCALRRNVDCFIAISQPIQRELEAAGIPAERRLVLANGVDTGQFAPVPAAAKCALRRRLGLPESGRAAIFCGRLVPGKGTEMLVKLWPAIREAVKGASLWVAGTGELARRLQELHSAGVHLLGPIDDVTPYLQAADLFVLPSDSEGLSIAMLEAMSAGLPALVTRVGAAPEVITHARDGWLIAPNAPESLREAIVQLLSDDGLRAQLGQRGRERICSAYSVDHTVAALLSVYGRLARHSNDICLP